jgi:hypothetical protein
LEVLERRSVFGTVEDNGDSTFTSTCATAPLHYQAGDLWLPINTYLEPVTEGGLTHRCPSGLFDVGLSKTSIPAILLTPDGGPVVEIVPLGTVLVDGYKNLNKVFYPDAYPQTDLDRYVTRWGLRQDYTLKAPGHPLVFDQQLVGSRSISLRSDGSLSVEGALGDTFTIRPPVLYEGMAPWITGTDPPPHGSGRSAELSWAVSGDVIRIDLTDVDLSDWTYPITIDPTTTAVNGSTSDRYIYYANSSFSTARDYTGSGTLGSLSAADFAAWATLYAGPSYEVIRGYQIFSMQTQIDDGATIDAASISLYKTALTGAGDEIHAVSCGFTSMGVSNYQITGNYGTESAGYIAASPGANGRYTLTLDVSKVSISSTGDTYIGFRGGRDLNNTTPSGDNRTSYASCDSTNDPQMTVTWSAPPAGGGLLFFLNN